MKVVIAPDSFKESMKAQEVCEVIKETLLQHCSSLQVSCCPLADGGEGTLETIIDAQNGKIEYYDVCGPLFNKIKAPIGYMNDTAIVECAKVCGLELLQDEQKNPFETTTYGIGELILIALDHGCQKIMICLGGSATNDGGIGMLSALGVQFNGHQDIKLTAQGLFDIQDIDISQLDQRLLQCEIMAVCDVDNPLCGENGATYIYGPQKGVKENEKADIDQAMLHYAKIADAIFDKENRFYPGSGAAGGLGYALYSFCRASLKPGFDVVAHMIDLYKEIQDADLVIVGEGKIDKQTQFGKTPYGVLKIAKKYHKPVYAFAGKVEDLNVLKDLGFENVYAITPLSMALSEALRCGKENLKKCVEQHLEDMLSEI